MSNLCMQRIIGGDDVQCPHQFPWLVTVNCANPGWLCTGSLIDPEWVLTAGENILEIVVVFITFCSMVFLKKNFNCILYYCIHLTNNVFFYILCQATVWLDAFSMMSTWALLTVATLMKTLSSSLWMDLMATNSSILTTPPMGKLRHSMMLPSFHYLSLHHLMVNK